MPKESSYNSSESTASLVSKARLGDRDAFGILYEKYTVPIYRFIYFKVSSKEEAEDITQVVFLKAWKSVERFKGKDTQLTSWLYSIARNCVIDHYRKKKDVLVEEPEIFNSLEAKEKTDTLSTSREAKEEVEKLLEQLPDKQREILVLRFINEVSNKEIAKIYKMRQSAIRKIQSRALATLREITKDNE
jgi:RNA polymerase sigma-70 factor (ECF subfamily)